MSADPENGYLSPDEAAGAPEKTGLVRHLIAAWQMAE
jgi:hypothetical protein